MTVAATITSKGQITIPKEIRNQLGLQSGDRIAFILDDEGKVTFIPVTKPIKTLKGMIAKPRKPVSLKTMNDAIKAKGAKL